MDKTSFNDKIFDWDYLHLTALTKETYFRCISGSFHVQLDQKILKGLYLSCLHNIIIFGALILVMELNSFAIVCFFVYRYECLHEWMNEYSYLVLLGFDVKTYSK